jgi:hypothetical protein
MVFTLLLNYVTHCKTCVQSVSAVQCIHSFYTDLVRNISCSNKYSKFTFQIQETQVHIMCSLSLSNFNRDWTGLTNFRTTSQSQISKNSLRRYYIWPHTGAQQNKCMLLYTFHCEHAKQGNYTFLWCVHLQYNRSNVVRTKGMSQISPQSHSILNISESVAQCSYTCNIYSRNSYVH